MQVYITVFADGPTRVLRFADVQNVGAEEAQQSILDLAARLKQVEEELWRVNARFSALHGASGIRELDLYGRAPTAGAASQQQGDETAQLALPSQVLFCLLKHCPPASIFTPDLPVEIFITCCILTSLLLGLSAGVPSSIVFHLNHRYFILNDRILCCLNLAVCMSAGWWQRFPASAAEDGGPCGSHPSQHRFRGDAAGPGEQSAGSPGWPC